MTWSQTSCSDGIQGRTLCSRRMCSPGKSSSESVQDESMHDAFFGRKKNKASTSTGTCSHVVVMCETIRSEVFLLKCSVQT